MGVGVGVGESATEAAMHRGEMSCRCFSDVAPCFESPHVSCVAVGREHGFSLHAHAHEYEVALASSTNFPLCAFF